MRRPAFTLLELLLVLVIIIMISAIGITGYQRQHARSVFKNGVVQLQGDLSLTRLLAMHTGNTYVFRYVPGSGVYEIAPLKTLQETIYRMNGSLEDDGQGALGGSLLGAGTDSFSYTPGPTSPTGMGGAVYTDDLFSPENIAADMAEAAQANAREARIGATNVDLTGGLGGGLTASPGALGVDAALGSGFDSSSNYGTIPNNYSTDYSGTGGEFALDASLGYAQTSAPPTTLRELNSMEKRLVDENTLASRVNLDGAVIRKQLSGSVIFTFQHLSDSTPTTLRSHRAKGVKNGAADPITAAGEGEDLGSALGGSLRSIPSGESGEGLSGGLHSIPGAENDEDVFAAATIAEDQIFVSLWSEALLFFPNGKTSNAIIGFASVGDYSFYSEIALRGMTGVSRISGISGTPPEQDPNLTALTQEQLIRLQNPSRAYSGADQMAASPGGALGGTAPAGGALGTAQDPYLDMAPTSDANPLDLGFDPNAETTPSVNYGSTERRSNYRFDESASGAPNAEPPLGTDPFSQIDSAANRIPAPGGASGLPQAPQEQNAPVNAGAAP